MPTLEMDKAAKPTGFLDLPIEVRQMIYKLHFTHQSVSRIMAYAVKKPNETVAFLAKDGVRLAKLSNLVLASHQVMLEALPFYYKTLKLRIDVSDSAIEGFEAALAERSPIFIPYHRVFSSTEMNGLKYVTARIKKLQLAWIDLEKKIGTVSENQQKQEAKQEA